MSGIDWSTIRRARAEALRSLKPLTHYPLIASGDSLAIAAAGADAWVLDVGGHDRRMKGVLEGARRPVHYRSLDIDKQLPHDYYSFDAVDRQFDLALVLDVVEHLSPEDVASLFQNLHRCLKPGSTIIVSTPNAVHPNRLWRDCTHITAFIYYELISLLLASGFDQPQLYRIREMRLRDWFLWLVAWPVIKFLEMDFAFGIAVVAKRGERANV